MGPLLRKIRNVLNFQVDELSYLDTQTLFIQYLTLINLNVSPDDIRFFLPYLKGIPAQIIYAANLIESLGVVEAKKRIDDIQEFDELRAFAVFDFLQDDVLSQQILIAFSKFEIISYDIVYEIFGESEMVYEALQKLFDLSLFYRVSASHEYLKLNTSIFDYLNRSKAELDRVYSEKIREIARESLQKPIVLDETSDYASFLFTLQNMIKEGKHIPPKYLIPSFIIKSIIREYYTPRYDIVIKLAKQILEDENRYDRQVIWESKNWLCLAYCRTSDERFFEEVQYFKEDLRSNETLKDYYFLLGFFHRNDDNMQLAEDYYRKVLEIDPAHSRSKRELVNVYLRNGEYMEALNWARDNYERQKTNILHIQAYFTCLIKKPILDDDDLETLVELIDRADKSLDWKAADIQREMQAEYYYYIDYDFERADTILNESLRLNSKNFFAFRALLELYRRENKLVDIQRLMKKYPDLQKGELD